MKKPDFLALACFFGLPLAAISVMAWHGYRLTSPSGSPYLGALVGALVGVFFLVAFICASGNDIMDVAINSLLVIILSCVLVPVFARAKHRAQQRALQKAALQRSHAPSPTKTPTFNGGLAFGSTWRRRFADRWAALG